MIGLIFIFLNAWAATCPPESDPLDPLYDALIPTAADYYSCAQTLNKTIPNLDSLKNNFPCGIDGPLVTPLSVDKVFKDEPVAQKGDGGVWFYAVTAQGYSGVRVSDKSTLSGRYSFTLGNVKCTCSVDMTLRPVDCTKTGLTIQNELRDQPGISLAKRASRNAADQLRIIALEVKSIIIQQAAAWSSDQLKDRTYDLSVTHSKEEALKLREQLSGHGGKSPSTAEARLVGKQKVMTPFPESALSNFKKLNSPECQKIPEVRAVRDLVTSDLNGILQRLKSSNITVSNAAEQFILK